MQKNKINHIAVIMDGNRRWAKFNNLPIFEGYNAGLKTLENFLDIIIAKQIKFITLYAFSTENWQRGLEEVSYIKTLLLKYLQTKTDLLIQNGIKFVCIGDYKAFGEEISTQIENLQNKTAHLNNLTLSLALNYGSRQEIVHAVNVICKTNKQTITAEDFINCLYTKNTPDPDIIIRTGGERRLSNFLLFQASYSELFFLDKMWPDFNKNDLEDIIEKFYKTERKYGK